MTELRVYEEIEIGGRTFVIVGVVMDERGTHVELHDAESLKNDLRSDYNRVQFDRQH